MVYKSFFEAYAHFQQNHSEKNFVCEIIRGSSGFTYTVKSRKEHENNLRTNFLNRISPPLSAETKASLKETPIKPCKPKKHVIDDNEEQLSSEALQAVASGQAKRKKPVPYSKHEFSAEMKLDINTQDSDNLRCIYCGDFRSGIVRDHVVSIAWRGGKRNYDRSHTVPSCPQCNNLLGDKALHNIADRAAYLIEAIEKHERKFLSTIDRTPKELSEIDHFLAASIRNAMYEKSIAIQRIDYAKQVAAGYYDYATVKHLIKQGREI